MFRYLKDNFIPDLELCESETAKYDAYSDKLNAVFEFKFRFKHYDTLMIRHHKYHNLMDISSEQGKDVFFVSQTEKGFFVWDLNKTPQPELEYKFLPRSTYFASNKKSKSPCYNLDIKYAENLWNRGIK